MFDDDRPSPKDVTFPRNMESMSISEIEDYIVDLKQEISRAEADIAKKKASQESASSIFKS